MKTKTRRDRACRETFAQLSEFLDGTLAARDCRELEEHLKGCKPCLAYLDSLRKTIRACQAYQAAPAPPPSPAVRQLLVESLLRNRSAGPRSRNRQIS
jgi:anti-sigma factor (TIGR02949 family)